MEAGSENGMRNITGSKFLKIPFHLEHHKRFPLTILQNKDKVKFKMFQNRNQF